MQRLDEILNPRYEPTYDDGSCIFDKVTHKLYHVDNDYITIEIAKIWNDLFFSNPNSSMKYHDAKYEPFGTINRKLDLRNSIDDMNKLIARKIKQQIFESWEENNNLPFEKSYELPYEDSIYEVEIKITKKVKK